MVPWPLPLVGAAAMIIWMLGIYGEIAGYLAIATLALIVVIELDAFTSVEGAILTDLLVTCEIIKSEYFNSSYPRSQQVQAS